MTSETTTAPAAGPTIPVEKLPATLRPIAAEVNALLREMPRLLDERQDGKYALLADGEFVSTWDTFADAMQAAYDRFGPDGRFVMLRIDRREYEWFVRLAGGSDQPARNGAATGAEEPPGPGPTIPVEHMPKNMEPAAADINAYMREAPRLLREGHDGRYALVCGGQVLSTWDTFSDALQAGYDRFGLDGPFMAQKISARDYERFLTLVDQPYGATA
jgi:hypothetical protein